MNKNAEKSLLPNGLRDALPPEAGHEIDLADKLVAGFRARGYERADPPLVEFEDNLFVGIGQAMSPHTFRLMDPVSQRMMGVRSDMTVPIARIATTRLANAPRPLRLAYAGPVLRVKGTQLRPERQFLQAGAELIGSDLPAADAEVITLAVDTLSSLGIEALSVDISLPTVVPAVCDAFELGQGTRREVRSAIDRKDANALGRYAGPAAETLLALLKASGPAEHALGQLSGLTLPAAASGERARAEAVLGLMAKSGSSASLTIDPVEYRGFEYQTGLSFTLFAKGVRGELGRGGRYAAGGGHEPATGFSLFLDSIARAAPDPVPDDRVFLPFGLPPDVGSRLRAEGHITVAALAEDKDTAAEARRLGCTHIYVDGAIKPLD